MVYELGRYVYHVQPGNCRFFVHYTGKCDFPLRAGREEMPGAAAAQYILWESGPNLTMVFKAESFFAEVHRCAFPRRGGALLLHRLCDKMRNYPDDVRQDGWPCLGSNSCRTQQPALEEITSTFRGAKAGPTGTEETAYQ